MKVFIFIFGVLCGGIISLIFVGDVDLLADKKDYAVELKQKVQVVGDKELTIELPKGTNLLFKSQYEDVGHFFMPVVITDLAIVQKKQSLDAYFVKEQP